MPGIECELAEKLQTDIRSQRLSDGLALFCPLSDETHYPLGSIWTLLGSCASMMIGGLAEGHVFRAGIAVGAGYTSEEGDIYGPVLAEAYRLESEVAVYPRVVISDCVANWFASFDRRSYSSDEERRVAIAMRDQCQNLVMKDTDGVLAIDFLKATTLQSLGGSEDLQEKIRAMSDFVGRMIETHRDNPKVLAKYVWVRDYIRSRIQEGGGT